MSLSIDASVLLLIHCNTILMRIFNSGFNVLCFWNTTNQCFRCHKKCLYPTALYCNSHIMPFLWVENFCLFTAEHLLLIDRKTTWTGKWNACTNFYKTMYKQCYCIILEWSTKERLLKKQTYKPKALVDIWCDFFHFLYLASCTVSSFKKRTPCRIQVPSFRRGDNKLDAVNCPAVAIMFNGEM